MSERKRERERKRETERERETCMMHYVLAINVRITATQTIVLQSCIVGKYVYVHTYISTYYIQQKISYMRISIISNLDQYWFSISAYIDLYRRFDDDDAA